MRRRLIDIDEALARLNTAADALNRRVTFMEVCGTHTMSAFRSGLHSLMPENVTLLSGPGCPVCVTAQGDIDMLIDLAASRDVMLCTYGDMIRVPGRSRTLQEIRGAGGDVRVVYSTLDAVRLAQQFPQRQVVFAAVGFETTAPATAAAVIEARRCGLGNFTVLASHKRIGPAMTGLVERGDVNLDGFLCPGHVSVIVGTSPYRPVVEQYKLPCVIGGFEEMPLVAALSRLTELARDGEARLINQYPEAVTESGNRVAMDLLARVFKPADVRWRGLGVIPRSGLVLRSAYQAFDAQFRFGLSPTEDVEPPGCLCGDVITGRSTPHDCRLFGRTCTPINPIGPCMVSSEGTCQAWFKYHRDSRTALRVATSAPAAKPVADFSAEALA